MHCISHCALHPLDAHRHCRRLIAERLEADEQTAEVRGLLWRLLPPADAAKFCLRVDDGPGDSDVSSGDTAGSSDEQHLAASFEARSDGKNVHVRGTTGVEVAAGILHFLKYRYLAFIPSAQLATPCVVSSSKACEPADGLCFGDLKGATARSAGNGRVAIISRKSASQMQPLPQQQQQALYQDRVLCPGRTHVTPYHFMLCRLMVQASNVP